MTLNEKLISQFSFPVYKIHRSAQMTPTSFSTHSFSKGHQSQKQSGELREVKAERGEHGLCSGSTEQGGAVTPEAP